MRVNCWKIGASHQLVVSRSKDRMASEPAICSRQLSRAKQFCFIYNLVPSLLLYQLTIYSLVSNWSFTELIFENLLNAC